MSIRFNKRINIGPVSININKKGISSATIHIGNKVSYNTRTKNVSVRLFKGLSYIFNVGKKK